MKCRATFPNSVAENALTLSCNIRRVRMKESGMPNKSPDVRCPQLSLAKNAPPAFRAEVGFDLEILGEIGVHLSFGEADDFGREFVEGQAALLRQVVNCPWADIQAPGNLNNTVTTCQSNQRKSLICMVPMEGVEPTRL